MDFDRPLSELNNKFDEILNQELSKHYQHKNWLDDFQQEFQNNTVNHNFCYVLSMQMWAKLNSLFISFYSIYKGRSSQASCSLTSILRDDSLEPKEASLLLQLRDAFYTVSNSKRYNNIGTSLNDHDFPLLQANSGKLLRSVIATERCFWHNLGGDPITLGFAKSAHLTWQMLPDGSQSLRCVLPKEYMIFIPVNPPFYFDPEKNKCGPVNIDISGDLLQSLLRLPPVPIHEVQNFYRALQRLVGSRGIIPEPHNEKYINLKSVRPVPILCLFGDIEQRNRCVGFARLNFRYCDEVVALSSVNEKITFKRNDKLYVVMRDIEQEKMYAHDLLEYGILAVSMSSAQELLIEQNAQQENLDFVVSLNEEKILDFNLSILPELKANGWEVKLDNSFPAYFVEEPDEWYSSIVEDESAYDWFKLEIGITIDNQQINILPFITKLLHDENNDMSSEYINGLDDDFKHMLQLEEGKFLILPNHRLKGFLRILTELYNTESNNANTLLLSKQEAAQLYHLEQFLGTTRLRWFGGDKLRELGKKLANFTGIETITPPKSLNAQLRAYQQAGLNWLNFLREYNFGGVLADDMGLGKTIQILALLAHEKEQGRLQKPCLIVVPTSLVSNWQAEIKKFAADLSLLIVHGATRADSFSKFSAHDVVITTYPLLIRDEDQLLQHEYYYVILDEAQRIKNFLTKSTRVLHKLHTQHRLCLSGTPLENNLGELWSLFHFVMPGLLYDYNSFIKNFKVPIEKNKDLIRQKNLAARLEPFMLRRTKQTVLGELPAKTVVIHHVKLGEQQRDLYESVRIAMDIKIQKEIGKKGLKRSHIIILDALLKLRQVCNDPRLVKLPSAKKVKESAKLEVCIELIQNCIAQGRKILVFSSFTSMLALIGQELHKKKLSYSLLTGVTRDRSTQINDFQTGITSIFLISLKTGGVGLNLTAADTVIHYDPWWNPAAEEQATDRAYRIGQNHPVTVYKLVTEGSVEEKILVMQNDKRALFDGLFQTKQQGNAAILSAQNLAVLFQPLAI